MDKRIIETAERLLSKQPDPCPRYRLLRDILSLSDTDSQFIEARKNMLSSGHVQALAAAQFPDGTWGRFHSQDTRVKAPFRTSEFAIRRALSLGLIRDDPVLEKACGFMERFLQGKAEWSDWAEKHEGWVPNTRFVTAATLSEVDPENELLIPFQKLWQEILQRTFAEGRYDPIAERAAQRELNGIHTRGKYLHLGMMYPLLLLSLCPLAKDSESALLQWLWDREGGIYYVTSQRLDQFPDTDSPRFSGWLDGLLLLARFPRASQLISPALAWIWEQRNPDGLWDFRPPAGGTPFFPLSDNWRRSENRVIDCSVKVLLLFSRKGLE